MFSYLAKEQMEWVAVVGAKQMKQAATLSQMKEVIDSTQTNKLCPVITLSNVEFMLQTSSSLPFNNVIFDLHQTILKCNTP